MADATVDTADGWDVGDADSLLVAISKRLAAERGVDPLEGPALSEYVDTDALARLFDPPGGRRGATFGRVTFHVQNYEVRVYHDGTFDVQPIEVDARTGGR